MTKPQDAESKPAGDGAKLVKHKTEARVTVETPARTLTDLRIRELDQSPHAPRAILDAGNFGTELTKDGLGVRGLACSKCGATEISKTGEPAVVLVAGSYHTRPSENRPTRTRCVSCGFGETPAQLFERLFGASAAKLSALRLGTHVEPRDFVAVRFAGKWHLGESFAGIVQSKEFALPLAFARSDFAAVVVNAHSRELAVNALRHPDWSDEWAAPVEVDRKARPLALPWTRPCVTDRTALEEAQRELQTERELEVRRKLCLVEAELRSEAGLR